MVTLLRDIWISLLKVSLVLKVVLLLQHRRLIQIAPFFATSVECRLHMSLLLIVAIVEKLSHRLLSESNNRIAISHSTIYRSKQWLSRCLGHSTASNYRLSDVILWIKVLLHRTCSPFWTLRHTGIFLAINVCILWQVGDAAHVWIEDHSPSWLHHDSFCVFFWIDWTSLVVQVVRYGRDERRMGLDRVCIFIQELPLTQNIT